MTDKDVVQMFAEAVGFGNKITERTRVGQKTSYQWSLSKPAHVREVLNKLLTFLGNRRAYKALNILDDLELSI